MQDLRRIPSVQPGAVRGLAKALARVIEEPQFAKNMGNSGRLLVERKFDEKQLVGRIVQVYEHIANGNDGQLPNWDSACVKEHD